MHAASFAGRPQDLPQQLQHVPFANSSCASTAFPSTMDHLQASSLQEKPRRRAVDPLPATDWAEELANSSPSRSSAAKSRAERQGTRRAKKRRRERCHQGTSSPTGAAPTEGSSAQGQDAIFLCPARTNYFLCLTRGQDAIFWCPTQGQTSEAKPSVP